MPLDPTLVTTRHALHAVAELVLAGPQHAASGTIRLRVTPGGFGTVAAPSLRVEGGDLVAAAVRVPIAGSTARALGTAVGVAAGRPDVPYRDGADLGPDDPLQVDAEAVALIASAFDAGDQALRAFAPGEVPVLWPEHFDVGIGTERVNYGLSPGDGFLPVPYAYVGPWSPPPRDEFWNAPFGRAVPFADLGTTEAVRACFAEARSRLHG